MRIRKIELLFPCSFLNDQALTDQEERNGWKKQESTLEIAWWRTLVATADLQSISPCILHESHFLLPVILCADLRISDLF